MDVVLDEPAAGVMGEGVMQVLSVGVLQGKELFESRDKNSMT